MGDVRRRLSVRLWDQLKGGWVRHELYRVEARRWILELSVMETVKL